MLIDTHCHLDAAEFDPDRDAVVARTREAGVARVIVPAISWDNIAAVDAACERYRPLCLPAYGFHPMYVAIHRPDHLDSLRQTVARRRPVAIGEIGLDYFVPGLDQDAQIHYFTEQLKIARDAGLPVLLHIRKAHDQVLKYLRRIEVPGGVAHAFNGSRQQAEAFIGLGFKLGFGGAATYSRASKLRELATTLPLSALVLETDAPDMAPVFAHKQRNSPEYLAQIAGMLAELRGMREEELIAATGENARAVLRLTTPEPALP